MYSALQKFNEDHSNLFSHTLKQFYSKKPSFDTYKK